MHFAQEVMSVKVWVPQGFKKLIRLCSVSHWRGMYCFAVNAQVLKRLTILGLISLAHVKYVAVQ